MKQIKKIQTTVSTYEFPEAEKITLSRNAYMSLISYLNENSEKINELIDVVNSLVDNKEKR